MTLPANMIPMRVTIRNAVAAALAEIHPENVGTPDHPSAPYHNDMRPEGPGRDRVVVGRIAIGNGEPLPMISVIEPGLGIEQVSTRRQPDNTTRATEWDLLIQGWVEDDETPGDQAYLLCAEVCRRLAAEKRRPDARPGAGVGRNFFGMGNKIYEMTIGSPVVRPSETVTTQSIFYLILTLKITEDMARPFG